MRVKFIQGCQMGSFFHLEIAKTTHQKDRVYLVYNPVLGHNPHGQVPPRHLPQGHIPPDTYPMDTYPQDTYPLGHIPPGQIPSGQIPPKQIRLACTLKEGY